MIFKKFARIAQLVEQGPLKPKVQGSSPCAGTNLSGKELKLKKGL